MSQTAQKRACNVSRGARELSAVVDKFAPERLADGSYGLSDERLNWHLENWGTWESSKWDAELAYTLSAGYSYGKDFDELCMDMDRECAYKTKAAIDSLTPAESCAVFNKIVRSVFRFPEDMESCWTRARWLLRKDLYRRGLV